MFVFQTGYDIALSFLVVQVNLNCMLDQTLLAGLITFNMKLKTCISLRKD